jgi:hypothetical protein
MALACELAAARLALPGERNAMSKIGTVLSGYAAALLLACALAYARTLFMHVDAAQASGGMQAFGDSLWFAGVFGLLALVPTGMAFHYLRPFESFWFVVSLVALAIAATGPIFALTIRHTPEPHSAMVVIGFLGLLRILGAPLLCLAFLLGGLLTPVKRARGFFFVAAGLEGLVSAYAFLCMFVLRHWLV